MRHSLHIMSAQICEWGITLASETVDAKSNEIPAVQELLKKMDIEGCMIVADALHCQQKTAEMVIDTILILKQRQYPLTTRNATNGCRSNGLKRAAQTINHIFQRVENLVAETSGANFTPNLLDWVHFRRVWRNVNHMNIIRNNQCARFVPCSTVAHQENFFLSVFLGQVFEENVHADCVAPWHHQKRGIT